MRKNLLLTTALVGVAFAFPAMANEAENPPADTTTTKQEAIYTNETGTTVADGTVFEGLGNTTEVERAGAVTVDTQGSIVIGNNVKFNKNTSNWSGGAMKALSGFEIGNNVTFEGNTSEKGGGALYIRQSPNTDATDPVASTTAKIGDGAKFIGNHASDSWHGGAIAEGKSSGDTFKQVKAWIRGLFNRADHESTSKASGFDADIYGVAMGIDKQINNAVKLGVGYAYSQADISSGIRDTDVDTHTAILYGQYRPANWYINTVVAYNWSDYDEKKAALGYSADASYDVESLGIQSMYGYETKLGEYDLTPEAGLRYAHISRDGYTDALGTSVASDDSDILTAVVGAKVAKDYTIGCNTIVRPELKAAVTYDLFDDGNNSYVSLANGSAYRVNGEKLDRLGFEFGAKVATEVSDNLEISAGWEGRFREDYQDHTAMLNAKYSF